MKTKKDRKGTKLTDIKPAKNAKPAVLEAKSTVKQVVIDLITANSAISNEVMVAAVKIQFPKSAFDARHASWYRSQARKGSLTGIPINIPPQTARKTE